jgi:hypothetical protein
MRFGNGFGPAYFGRAGATVTPPPVNTVAPAITGTARVGQLLTVSNGTWSNSPTGYTYQWRNNGANIGGETASTLTLVTGDIGDSIDCVITATNAGGSTNASATAVGPVLPLAPTNSVLPAITGNPGQFRDLTVSNGTWANTPSGYTYQWRRDGVDISGQTASTHTIVAADVGHSLDCVVTATNAGGSTAATAAAKTALSPQPTSFANVSVIIGGNGAHGSNSFTDESGTGNTIVAGSDVAVATDQSKFGGGSVRFFGTPSYLFTNNIPAAFNLGAGDYTIELFARPKIVTGQQILIHKGYPNNKSFAMYLNGTAAGFESDNNGGAAGSNAAGLSMAGVAAIDTWIHLAVVRTGNALRGFVNGAKTYEAIGLTTPTHDIFGSSEGIYIGCFAGGTGAYNGYMDELRVIKGEGIYTQDFVVPQQAHPRS